MSLCVHMCMHVWEGYCGHSLCTCLIQLVYITDIIYGYTWIGSNSLNYMLWRNSPCNMSQGVLRRTSIKCDSLAGLTGLVEAILTLFQSYIPILIVYISLIQMAAV